METARVEYTGVLLIVLFLIGVVWYGLSLRGSGNSEWLRVIEVGASTVLSLSLVLVYLWQNRILVEQRRLMSAGYSPAVSVQNVSFSTRATSEFHTTGNSDNCGVVEVSVTNHGNDIASNLKLECVMHYDTYPFDNASLLCRCVGRVPGLRSRLGNARLSPRQFRFRAEEESNQVHRRDGPVLPPSMDTPTRLYAQVGVNYEGDDYCSIPDAIDIAAGEGASEVLVGFVLTYENAFGDTNRVPLNTYRIEGVSVGTSFSDIDNHESVPYQELKDRHVPEYPSKP
jgi:hypothetical protein